MAEITAIPGARRLGGGTERSTIVDWLSTTDHKRIGILYIATAFVFFFLAGAMAMAIRAELAQPGLQFVDAQTYDELFTMHGTLMLLFFAGPAGLGLGNYLVPLQIGAADMAFPRLNALSYWLYLFGGVVMLLGFPTATGAAAAGWTGYVPLSDGTHSAGPGMDLWLGGVALVGFSGIASAVNFIATIFGRRAPGMTMFRMPIFTWNLLVTSTLILFAFPPLTAAVAMLAIDRHLGGTWFDPAMGGDALLWQDLFWFFGHPEVYILVLPAFGIVSEVIPTFSRRPLFGYRLVIFATIAIAALSMSVWAHHMFTTGFVSLPFFSLMSLLIAVPTGIKIFNWLATMLRGQIVLSVAMMWAIAVIYVFVIGGITGVILASPPLDFQFQDTYFVVAHFHNTLIGGTVFAIFAGIYFWFPKMTGRFLDERLGRIHVYAWIVGFILTFLPQYILGAEGMPRRIADYPASRGWTSLNLLSSLGGIVLAVGMLPFVIAVARALREPRTAGDDPWEANSLEWATTSPPPHHNFTRLPLIRSERPVFDARMSAARDLAAGDLAARDLATTGPAASAGNPPP